MPAVVILEKGDTVKLTGAKSVGKALMGLGWDVNEGQSNHAFDLDASLVTRDAAGEAIEVCYFGNLKLGQWVEHTSDNLTGEGEGDDEQIKIDLGNVPSNVAFIDLVVNIYQGAQRGQYFHMVESAFARLVNEANGNEVARVNLTDDDDAWEKQGLWLARIDVRRAPVFESVCRFDDNFANLQGFANSVLPTT